MTSIKKWVFKMSESGRKDFGKLDKPIQKRMMAFLEERLLPSNNPRLFGKPLTGKLSKYWAFRVGTYRMIVDIQDNTLIILVVTINHRREVYKEIS